MKYVNKNGNSIELVIDLLLSLESAVLIEDFLYNVKTIYIHTENNHVPVEAENCIKVSADNLNKLAKVKYLSPEEFNTIVINRLCEGLRLYILKKNKVSTYEDRLKLADYSQIVQSEIRSVELSILFQVNQDEIENELERINKHILMESGLSDSSELEEREETFKNLCKAYCEEEVTNINKPGIKGNRTYKSMTQESSDKTDEFLDSSENLHFIHVPRHLATTSESKDRLYPKLQGSSKDYIKYIQPLTDQSLPPVEPNILAKEQLLPVFDKFNDLHILGEDNKISDYMNLLDTYKSASPTVKDTFRKRFDVKQFDIVNKHSAEELSESRKKSSNKPFTNAHGIIAHCYWEIYQDDTILSLQTKARAENNITDYLDTLIRYFIFVEKKLLGEVLTNFAIYNSSEYNDKFAELNKLQIDKDNPQQDSRGQSSKETRYERLAKEVDGYNASERDVIQYGSDVIKAHFNHDILKYVIQTYLHAQKKHHEIIKKYKKIK